MGLPSLSLFLAASDPCPRAGPSLCGFAFSFPLGDGLGFVAGCLDLAVAFLAAGLANGLMAALPLPFFLVDVSGLQYQKVSSEHLMYETGTLTLSLHPRLKRPQTKSGGGLGCWAES